MVNIAIPFRGHRIGINCSVMLTLSKKHLESFETPDTTAFVDYMLRHIAEHFPAHTLLLGKKDMETFIKFGREQAKARGFATRYEVTLYIDLMVMLGSGFYTDPLLPWSAYNITHTTGEHSEHYMDKLYKMAMQYMDSVVGHGNAFPVDQLQHFQHVPLSGLKRGNTPSFEQDVLLFFKHFWWAKYRQSKQEAKQQLVRSGIEVAQTFGFTNLHVVEYFVVLTYLLGHEFYKDPMYAYLVEILNDTALQSETEKYEKLHACVCEKIIAGFSI